MRATLAAVVTDGNCRLGNGLLENRKKDLAGVPPLFSGTGRSGR
jgi:hypothetical protein